MPTYKPKDSKTQKKYCFYDFEWTYNKEKTESYVYAWSLKCQEEDAIYKFGLDIEEDLVKEIKNYADKNHDCDIILYAHNGQKADYPLIAKYLPKYFSKQNLDISSKMKTIAYRWNN